MCFQVKYNHTHLSNCREEFVFKPISNQLNIIAVCNLSFTRSLNASYFEMNE